MKTYLYNSYSHHKNFVFNLVNTDFITILMMLLLVHSMRIHAKMLYRNKYNYYIMMKKQIIAFKLANIIFINTLNKI